MPYLGKSPSFGVRQRYQYTATASQTTFSGTDTANLTLNYTDNNFVDVYQNGVLLKGGGNDYTATSGTSVVLATGATADDVIEIIVYDAFSAANFYSRTDSDSRYLNVAGDTMTGSLDLNGTELVLDADGDTSITSDTDDQIDIKIAGSDSLRIKANEIENVSGDLTIDVAGDIILDADDGDIQFSNGGTLFGSINSDASSPQAMRIQSHVSDGDIIFKGNDGGSTITAMAIDMSAGGTVGIGTTSVAANLHVQSGDGSISPSVHADELLVEGSANSGITIGSGTSSIGSLRFADSGGDSQGNITYNHSDNTFSIATDDTEAIKINSQQNISFGNNDPSDDTPAIGIQFDTSSTTTSFMNIGHTTGAGTSDGFVRFVRSNSIIGQIRTDGVSNVQYATSSDYRLKENIVTEWDATTRLKQLKPSRFNFKEEKDRTRDGFIAHEVSSIVPEAVGGEKDAMTKEVLYVEGEEIPEGKKVGDVKKPSQIDPQTIDHSKLVPLLTKALQESIARADALEARIKKLEDG